nr:MAG TPA_asm: hypothetical protein [Caudoviricetes sp.]
MPFCARRRSPKCREKEFLKLSQSPSTRQQLCAHITRRGRLSIMPSGNNSQSS